MTLNSSKNSSRPLGSELLIAWYGDDFTGAAAVMEVLTFAGLPSVLFLDLPSAAQLAQFPGLQGIGVASTARAQDPSWMNETLPKAFKHLGDLAPQLLHYKVCSTLDSSPETGSIGRAIEIGSDLFGSQTVPVLIAAPQMRRYQAFGHLFAGVGDQVARLDRHPVMSRHPVTPMTESDVALHISRQSNRIAPSHLSLEALALGSGIGPRRSKDTQIDVVALDSIDQTSETAAGQALWNARKDCPFVVGSQGIEYALVEHWCKSGLLERASPPAGLGKCERMISVSGSVSPTTADQISWSRNNGFECIEFDATQVCVDHDHTNQEIERTVDAALSALSNGRDPLIHTATGPDDPAVASFIGKVGGSQLDMSEANQKVGEALGQVLLSALQKTNVTRAVVSGGDTSGFATKQLGIFALSALAPTIPGASIFRAHSDGALDGLELALKGGQMGSPDYFGWVRDGGGLR